MGKLLLIARCEGAGFVGGAIYPALFVGATVGSALGAVPVIATNGDRFVYLSTAAAMATALAALLNTNLFAILLVLVLQGNEAEGTVSAHVMALMFAVFVHCSWSRLIVTPRLNMVSTQQVRRDIMYRGDVEGPQATFTEVAAETAKDTCSTQSSERTCEPQSRSTLEENPDTKEEVEEENDDESQAVDV